MTLAIGFKGSEGVVLAADSRVTIQAITQPPGAPHQVIIPATYDNATKLLKVQGQDYVAAVTYNAGAVGVQQPRTAHSLLAEFEAQLAGEQRLSVEAFAQRLSDFFNSQWTARGGGPEAPWSSSLAGMMKAMRMESYLRSLCPPRFSQWNSIKTTSGFNGVGNPRSRHGY